MTTRWRKTVLCQKKRELKVTIKVIFCCNHSEFFLAMLRFFQLLSTHWFSLSDRTLTVSVCLSRSLSCYRSGVQTFKYKCAKSMCCVYAAMPHSRKSTEMIPIIFIRVILYKHIVCLLCLVRVSVFSFANVTMTTTTTATNGWQSEKFRQNEQTICHFFSLIVLKLLFILHIEVSAF